MHLNIVLENTVLHVITKMTGRSHQNCTFNDKATHASKKSYVATRKWSFYDKIVALLVRTQFMITPEMTLLMTRKSMDKSCACSRNTINDIYCLNLQFQ